MNNGIKAYNIAVWVGNVSTKDECNDVCAGVECCVDEREFCCRSLVSERKNPGAGKDLARQDTVRNRSAIEARTVLQDMGYTA